MDRTLAPLGVIARHLMPQDQISKVYFCVLHEFEKFLEISIRQMSNGMKGIDPILPPSHCV